MRAAARRRSLQEASSIASARELTTASPDATEALAERIGAACAGGELILLSGELGTGKTCFVRGLARGLGCDAGAVRSPSFTLLQRYEGITGQTERKRRTLHHYDVYFTTALEDLERAGLAEALAAGDVVAIEWGERFGNRLPADRLEVAMRHVSPEERALILTAKGPSAGRLLERAVPNGARP